MLSRLKTVGLWVLMIALAALFVLTAWDKLYGVPPMVEIFEKVGLGRSTPLCWRPFLLPSSGHIATSFVR